MANKLRGTKRCYFKKQSREVIENKRLATKNKPKQTQNKAGKLLKIRSCGKNKAKNKPGHVVENKQWLKKQTGENPATLKLSYTSPLKTSQAPQTPVARAPASSDIMAKEFDSPNAVIY